MDDTNEAGFVHITREIQVAGILAPILVYIDDLKPIKIYHGGEFKMAIAAGKHNVRARGLVDISPTPVLEFDVKPNLTVYQIGKVHSQIPTQASFFQKRPIQ